jgi:hypothetical protein
VLCADTASPWAYRSLSFFLSLSTRSCSWVITCSIHAPVVQAIHHPADTGDKKQATYNLFAAYIHTMPLEELIESVERARLDAKLQYVVIYGAACSYCLSRAGRLDGSYLRTFALELKEQLAQTLAAFVTSILREPRRRQDEKEAAEPPLRQVIEVLEQVMCTHDAEKLAISVLEIYRHSIEERGLT